MKTMLKAMQKSKCQISDEVMHLFEDISNSYKGNEGEGIFIRAMEEHLTKEQRYQLFEKVGSCNGTAYDKERRAFAQEHMDKSLKDRIELFNQRFGRKILLGEDNIITVNFACGHGYYKHAPKGTFQYQASLESYFGRCAGGRLYELEKALGIKLRMKEVDITPLEEKIDNPVIFRYEIM